MSSVIKKLLQQCSDIIKSLKHQDSVLSTILIIIAKVVIAAGTTSVILGAVLYLTYVAND